MWNCIIKIIRNFQYWILIKPYKWIWLKLFIFRPNLNAIRIRTFLNPKNGTLFVVIAFNNDRLIKMQIEKLKKYSVEKFDFLIADNSSDDQVAKKIRNLCFLENISYVRVPRQHIFRLSDSHGVALNWVYYQIIRKTNFDIIAFLDHDIFPVKEFRISSIIDNWNIYGVKHFAVHENNKYVWNSSTPDLWYLWPGFTFFRLKYVKGIKVDFMPMSLGNAYFDTGGSNWKNIYSNVEVGSAGFALWEQVQIGDGQIRQYDYIDLINKSWVHIINGSFWQNNENFTDILDEKIRFVIYQEKSDNFAFSR